MDEIFKVNVNNTFDFDISKKEITDFDAIKTSELKAHILYYNKSYTTEITNSNFNKKKYQVKVNNNTYNVIINNDLDAIINQMGFSLGTIKHINTIVAPMPGLILDLNIKVGEQVKQNDPLLILEAMKMENVIASPRDGVIKSISIKKGEAVNKNQLLIELEK